MATELAAAYVTIIPSLKGAGKTIEKALSGIDTTSTGQSWGKSISSGMVKTASIGVKAIGAIGTAVGGLAVAGGISRALKLDEAEFKFKSMGIDVEKAMKSCNEAVSGTAFGLDAAASVAAQLGTSGVQAGEQMTEALKGAAGMAAMGGVALERVGMVYTKVAAQGKLQGDELMQFSEMGVNALGALADYFGVTQAKAREMVKNGEVDFAEFSAAMNKMYGEAAKGANETFTGAMSNVRAALSRIGAKFASPALEGLRKVFVALIPAIDAVSKLLDPLVGKFTKFVDAVSGKSVASIEAFTKTLNETGSVAKAVKAAIASLFEGSALQRFFDTMRLKVQGWIAALKAGVSPLQLIQVELGKLADKGVKALSKIGDFLKTAFDGTAIETLVLKIEGWVAALKAGLSPFKLLNVELGKLNDKASSSGFAEILRAQLANLPQPIQNIIGVFSELFSKINVGGAAAAAAFAVIFAKFGAPLKAVATALVAFGGKIGGVFKMISSYGGIVAFISTKIATLGSAIAFAGGPLGFAVSLFSKAKLAIMGLLTPVNLIMVGIAALAAAFVYLMTTNEGFRNTIMGLVSSIGQSLAPIITTLGQALKDIASSVLPVITNLIAMLVPVLGQIITIIFQVVAALAPVVTMLVGTLVPIVSSIIQLVMAVVSAVMSAVIPVISAVLGAIQTALPIIQMVVMGVMTAVLGIVNAVWPVIQDVITIAVNFITQLIQVAMPIIQAIITTVMGIISNLIQTVWPTIQNVITTAVNVIRAIIQVAWPIIRGIIETVMNVIMTIIQTAWPVIQSIIDLVMHNVMGIINTVWPIISGVIDAAMSFIQGIIDAGMAIINGDWEGAWNIIKDALSSAWESIKTGVSNGIDALMEFLSGLPDKIMGVFANAGSWLLDAGSAIIHGLWDGISGALDWLGGQLGGIGDFIAAHKGPESYDLKLLIPNGGWIMEGLNTGIERGLPALRSTLAGVAGEIQGFGSDLAPFDDMSASVKTWRNVEFSDDATGIGEVVSLLQEYLPGMAEEKGVYLDKNTLVGKLAKPMNKELGKMNRRAGALC